MDIQITINGGRFADEAALRGIVEDAIGPVVTRAIEVFHDNTPIGKTGLLHDSWEAQGMEWEGFSLNAPIVNTAENKGYYYGRRVNVVSKRNAGYLDRALSAARVAALQKLAEQAPTLVHRLWHAGGGGGSL